MLLKKNKGITLVALVITIVILLILAGISISALTNTGIFQKAKDAKSASENAERQEESKLAEYEDELSRYTSNDSWDNGVNKPELMTGMTAVNFEKNEITKVYKTNLNLENTNNEKNTWYNYEDKRWANAITKDNDGNITAYWVWIPRFAYRIHKDDEGNKTEKFDIVFLIGTTDNYYDDNGNLKVAQRQKKIGQKINTDGETYTVHPAFTNETKINYVNGGWKKELTGIWVAKFEAGFYDKGTDLKKISSKVEYTQAEVYTASNKNESARNYLNGKYGSTKTNITYPVFLGEKYSMNYMNHSDAYSISRALTDDGNVYGLDKKMTDSYLMKNSEWGAVAYLGQSKYGLDGKNIRINNLNVEDDNNFVYAMTGYSAKNDDDENTKEIKNVWKWNEEDGTVASSTGNVYGIYDLSGGVWERTASIINNGNDNLNKYGKSLMNALNNGDSSAYVTVYPKGENEGEGLEDAGKNNYEKSNIYGDAIRETSIAGVGQTSWYNDLSCFVGSYNPLFVRGGYCWDNKKAGLFAFYRFQGGCGSFYSTGFRSVLVVQ